MGSADHLAFCSVLTTPRVPLSLCLFIIVFPHDCLVHTQILFDACAYVRNSDRASHIFSQHSPSATCIILLLL